ncbi:hypothetical protein IQ07DRAFT_616393 [Pyrenochaeta sp. DS3sAY3a]|nr:hypothetical protein IQ07DRAFT_616393 [Pyrenochaeta sp. DS3sAY3a]
MATPVFLLDQKTPTGLIIAQTVGITASAYLFGQNASLSFVSIPAVMQAPAPLAAKQWSTVFTIGQAFGPPLAIASALATGYAASQLDPKSLSFKLNVAATLLLPSIVPFTFAFIVPTNKKLLAKRDQLAAASLEDKAIEVGVAQDETVHALIDKWGTLNLARAVIVGTGALCAIIAAVI